MSVRVYTDFDGTVTERDTLVHLLDHYAGPGWLKIERRVEDGSLSEERGLREEIALLAAPWDEARDLVLREVAADPGFAVFAAWCGDRGWPLEILSGGLAPLIRAVLAREGLARLPLHANDLAFEDGGRWRVVPATSPRIRALCNHCKSHWLVSARERGERVVYIGDGCTDRCPGGHADLLFAKGSLREWCEREGVAHRPFERFAEIQEWLEGPAGRGWIAAG